MIGYPEGGTAVAVIEWVGTDPVRAQAALDAEHQRPNPRKGVINYATGQIPAFAAGGPVPSARPYMIEQPAEQPGPITFRHRTDGRKRTMPANSEAVARYERHKNWVRV